MNLDTGSSGLRNSWQRWEDQHPLTRNSFILVLLELVFALILRIVIFLTPRLVDLSTLFKIAVLERVWLLTNVVLFVILVSSIIRLTWLVYGGRASLVSLLLACIMPFILWLPIQLMPTFFEAATSHQLQRPYSEVFVAFENLCNQWDETHGQRDNYIFFPQNEALGLLGNTDQVTVWRESNTVFFDFGDDEQSFGLACALGGERPTRNGRLSRDFSYRQIEGKYYEFYGSS